MAAHEDRDLLLDRERLVLRLLDDLGQLLAAVQLVAGGLVQVAGELRERRQGAVLREVQLERARRPSSSPWSGPRSPRGETEMPMFMAGRWPALNRSVSRKIWPSVIEITLVGM